MFSNIHDYYIQYAYHKQLTSIKRIVHECPTLKKVQSFTTFLLYWKRCQFHIDVVVLATKMSPKSRSPLSFGESAASLQTAGLKSFGSKNSRPNGRSPFDFSPLSNNFDFYGFGIDKVRNLGGNGSITVSSCHTSSPHHTFKQLCSSNLSYKTIDCNQLPKVTPKVDTKGTIKLFCGLSTSLSA